MHIDHFAAGQNLVFVPALVALLAATVLICLPIVFAQRLRRSGRRAPLVALATVLAVVALVGAAWLAGVGFRTLGDERAAVRAQLAAQYGLRLDAGQVGELIDGGRPPLTRPVQAAAAGLEHPAKAHPLRLVPTEPDADTYELTFGGRPWPR